MGEDCVGPCGGRSNSMKVLHSMRGSGGSAQPSTGRARSKKPGGPRGGRDCTLPYGNHVLSLCLQAAARSISVLPGQSIAERFSPPGSHSPVILHLRQPRTVSPMRFPRESPA